MKLTHFKHVKMSVFDSFLSSIKHKNYSVNKYSLFYISIKLLDVPGGLFYGLNLFIEVDG